MRNCPLLLTILLEKNVSVNMLIDFGSFNEFSRVLRPVDLFSRCLECRHP